MLNQLVFRLMSAFRPRSRGSVALYYSIKLNPRALYVFREVTAIIQPQCHGAGASVEQPFFRLVIVTFLVRNKEVALSNISAAKPFSGQRASVLKDTNGSMDYVDPVQSRELVQMCMMTSDWLSLSLTRSL